MDVDKICLTCLSSTGPLLSIYDGGTGSCLADMIREFTKTKVSCLRRVILISMLISI